MVTGRCHPKLSNKSKERTVGAISQRVELYAVMLDSWICDWADSKQFTPYAHSTISLDTFYGGTSASLEGNLLKQRMADRLQ